MTYKKLIYTLLCLVPCAMCLVATAQQPDDHCATMQADADLRAKYPQMGSLNDFERALQQKIVEIKARQALSRPTAELVTIPVVVHIINNGEAVGQGRNISEAQIKSQIETLNEDFRRRVNTRGYNTDTRGADIEIEFCLAQLNPQGVKMVEAGIDRVNGQRANWIRADIEGALKPSTSWDPNKYFNIWVLDFATSESLLGYAQFPSQSDLPGIPTNGGPGSTDGVVIQYTSFGNSEKGSFSVMKAPYNLGRTLTHETGHWLGLRHIWGDTNCGDDFCSDTPTQASESRGCSKGRVSCGTTNMVENYMDYSDDGCFNIFTKDQKTRMRAVLELSPRRSSLVTSNLCGQTIAAKPTANFQAENRTVLLGGSVRFSDLSSNFPNKWAWEFEGGEPAVSNDQNPTVVYNTAGKYKVTLTATNSLGASTPATKTTYIEVLNIGICGTTTNFKGTETLVRNPTGSGYVSSQNSRKIKAVSEYFDNTLGYTNLRGVVLKFGMAKAAKGKDSESLVRVTAWNARGIQNGPGSVLETKEIPLRKILDDVAANKTTIVTFDKNLPLFSLPYHIGVEFDYAAGDSVALYTTKNGESTASTSWEQDANGVWDRYIIRTGLNVAHAITAQIGMKPSVQVATSAQFIDPGQAVTLQARGAGVLNWSPTEALNTTLGPQVSSRPTRTITYTVKGTGSDVCSDSAQVTLYLRNVIIAGNPVTNVGDTFKVSPNPTDGAVAIYLNNAWRGNIGLKVFGLNSAEVFKENFLKNEETLQRNINLNKLPSGTYLIQLENADGQKVKQKIRKF